MLVRLVVTGDLERHALGPSITRIFAATSPHLAIDVAHKLEFLPVCRVRNAEKASHDWGWWREERHPKRYIDFLVGRAGGAYSDAMGARVLATLDWPAAGALPTATRFARSLFEDLASLLETANPLGPGDTHEGTSPARRTRSEERVLRNL